MTYFFRKKARTISIHPSSFLLALNICRNPTISIDLIKPRASTPSRDAIVVL